MGVNEHRVLPNTKRLSEADPSLDLHHTLEFRQHKGTADASVACAWADFLLDFVRTALRLPVDEIAAIDPAVTPLSDYVPSLLKLPYERPQSSLGLPVPY